MQHQIQLENQQSLELTSALNSKAKGKSASVNWKFNLDQTPRSSIEANLKQQDNKNLKTCQHKKFIIMIKSAIHHVSFRNSMRDTWLKDLQDSNLTEIGYYFVIGKKLKPGPDHQSEPSPDTPNEPLEIPTEISSEQAQFQDLIVSDVLDSYYNVTKKVVLGMGFVLENCPKVQYVTHIDDDVYVSLPRFKKFIKNFDTVSNFIDCGTPVIKPYEVLRPDNAKHPEWGLSKQVYSESLTPTYCNGPCYGMPIHAYQKIYSSLSQIDFVEIEKVDDLILTGLVRAQLKIPLYEASGLFCWHIDNKKRGVDVKMQGFYNLGKLRHEW